MAHAITSWSGRLRKWSAPPAGTKSYAVIVHGDRANLAGSNVASVFYSIVNMLNTATIIVVILLSPGLARKFGNSFNLPLRTSSTRYM